MRAALVLLVVGCHKDTSQSQPPPQPGPAPVVAPAPADAAPNWIELLHNSSTSVTVSSTVANAQIRPQHLVDGDLNTAWNSRTGELAGAWIEVRVPAGATLEELRMTAGHTGHGPKGEDYFTMNPRIRAVTVLVDGKPVGTFKLDIAKRTLQPLRVHATGLVRIRVDGLEPGSKKSWRETCVSELEAWGTLAAGEKPVARKAYASVYEPPEPPKSFCDRLDEMRAEREAARHATYVACHSPENTDPECGIDEAGDPDCASYEIKVANLEEPWSGASQECVIQDNIYGPADCTITVATEHGTIQGPSAMFELKSGQFEIAEATLRDVLPGGPQELVIRYSGSDHVEQVIVCRASPPACSEPVAPGTALGPKTLVFK